MKLKLYSKSAVSLQAKIGAYAYVFVCGSEVHKGYHKFKSTIHTLTHADCAAFGNSIHHLLKMEAKNHITELEVITDSGKVKDLIEVSKSDKYCHDIAKYWREVGKLSFPLLANVTVTKIDGSKVIAGNADYFYTQQCKALSAGELNKMIELIK